MKIPSEFKIGALAYKVQIKKKINRSGHCWGRSYLGPRVIVLATHGSKGALTKSEMVATFWHEVMHCMLFQMGHALWKDEAFVDAVGMNMEHLLRTAKFKD